MLPRARRKETDTGYDPGPKPFSLESLAFRMRFLPMNGRCGKLGALNPRIEFRLEGPKSKPIENLSTKFVKRFVLKCMPLVAVHATCIYVVFRCSLG